MLRQIYANIVEGFMIMTNVCLKGDAFLSNKVLYIDNTIYCNDKSISYLRYDRIMYLLYFFLLNV